MFRSDFPITIVPMISSVTWDVTRGGMARTHDGLMMLLMIGRNHTLRLVVFYDVWLSFMMDAISFMMMDVSCMVDGFIYFIALVSWIRWGWCILFSHMYNLSLSYPVTCIVDDWAFWINLPRGIQKKCILFWGHWNFHYSFIWMWIWMNLVLVNLNVIQRHGILKESNLLCMFMYAFSWMDVIASAIMCLMWMV